MSDIPAPLLSIALEENLHLHAVDAEIFAPFVIERLGAGRDVTSADLAVTQIDERGQEQIKAVRLIWQPQVASAKPLAVQERVRTEWGALGVACALIPPLL